MSTHIYVKTIKRVFVAGGDGEDQTGRMNMVIAGVGQGYWGKVR